MTTPLEDIAGFKVGSVESVAPSELHITLDLDAPQATALNTGAPTAFPRINNYVLIPNEAGAVVGMIVWIGIDPAPLAKSVYKANADVVDLPIAARRMIVTPVGTLKRRRDSHGSYVAELDRGVNSFPSVGDSVLLPSNEQLKAIVESTGSNSRVFIGTSPLALNARIAVDPDKLFGRHIAVLGNTGSGKSCTVAGLVRWSLEAAQAHRSEQEPGSRPNARFILLDPNGEYFGAFADMGEKVRRFHVVPPDESVENLRVPAWLWNSHEWASFSSAQPGAQRPLLMQALRDMRAGQALKDPFEVRAIRLFPSYRRKLEELVSQGVSGYSTFPGSLEVGKYLRNLSRDAATYAAEASGEIKDALEHVVNIADEVAEDRSYVSRGKEGFNGFSESHLRKAIGALRLAIAKLPTASAAAVKSEDAPIPFDVAQLPEQLEFLAAEAQSGHAAQFVGTLSTRIKMMLDDRRKRPVCIPDQQPTLAEWLNDYLGEDGANNGEVAIVDLSLVPSDVVSTIIAVFARLAFEALQRYRKLNDESLPTVLVLEEAHTFIKRHSGDSADYDVATHMCREVFERIAREGRKFGLGLVLSSQRPSELSATVVAQCNSFLLHRIVNDRDQELVRRLVPDKLGGLLADLPNLPTRQAILLGWATPTPILVEMNELPEEHRPRSADPDFWAVWTGLKTRRIDWDTIADDWVS